MIGCRFGSLSFRFSLSGRRDMANVFVRNKDVLSVFYNWFRIQYMVKLRGTVVNRSSGYSFLFLLSFLPASSHTAPSIPTKARDRISSPGDTKASFSSVFVCLFRLAGLSSLLHVHVTVTLRLQLHQVVVRSTHF